MHEYHAVEKAVKKVLEMAGSKDASKISRVTLGLNELSGMDKGSVELYFESISEGTAAQGAKLVIKPSPAELKCRKCGEIFEYKDRNFTCPKCGGLSLPSGTGRHLHVQSVEF